ncbi:MAG: hypothetical protein ACE5EY_14875 [Anaerolineae bacterium]
MVYPAGLSILRRLDCQPYIINASECERDTRRVKSAKIIAYALFVAGYASMKTYF